MSTDDKYHVMLAGGLQEDVAHVRFICCPAITVTDVGVSVTDVIGTVIKRSYMACIKFYNA